MSKLTKAEVKTHDKACELLALSRDLTYDERLYVLDNWQESAQHVNSRSGAFFTPSSLARDVSIYTPDGGTLLDLCAGIGTLAFHCIGHTSNTSPHTRLTCVEVNLDYVKVGRRVVPEAEWVCVDVFDLPKYIRRTDWDCVVCNPPFGRSKDVPVQGVTYDLNVLAVAVRLSQYGVFILPQMSCPFAYSGHQNYQERPSRDFDRFKAKVGDVRLQCSSIDCSMYRDDWEGVSPGVEIVYYDLLDQRLHDVQNSDRYKDLVRRIEVDVDKWNEAVRVNKEIQEHVRTYLVGGEPCPACYGTGQRSIFMYMFGAKSEVKTTCQACGGDGVARGKIDDTLIDNLDTSDYDDHTIPVADEVDDTDDKWLYDSRLKYIEQITRYRAHQQQNEVGDSYDGVMEVEDP